MRLSLRVQLLVPLLTLLLGVAGMSVWTAQASVARARQQIEKQLHDITATVTKKFPRNRQTLPLMKGLSGAEFLPYAGGKPLEDDDGPVTTLPLDALPAAMPP